MTASTRAHVELSGAVGLTLTEGDIRSDDPHGFWMRGVHWAFGDILLSDLTFSPISSVPMRNDDGDRSHLNIGFLLVGDVTIEHRGAHLRFVPGMAAFFTSLFAVAASNAVPSRVLVISIPRDELAGHGIDPTAEFGGLSYSALLRDPLLPFLETLLPIIQNHSIPTEPTATILGQLVAGLFIADEAQIGPGRAEERQLRYAAEELIGRSYTDQAFTPAALARRLGVGITELNTAFDDSGSGETVAATITSRRLTRAISVLGSASDGAPPSILAAARTSGFTGLPSLELAVQATYGVSTITILTGLRRLNSADYPDEGGVQRFVARVRGPGTRPA